MPKEGERCELHLNCTGFNENCTYGNRLSFRQDDYTKGCTLHDDYEIRVLELEIGSMTTDGLPERSTTAFERYSKMSARLKELKGQ